MNTRNYTSIFMLLILLASCRKKEVIVPDPNLHFITSFVFLKDDNANTLKTDAEGIIINDTIRVTLPAGTTVNNLIPRIVFSGKVLNPLSQEAQDFTKPVTYTVTANNGSSRNYPVVIRLVSGNRKITSFVLKSNQNPALSHDITGVISGDTILLNAGPAVQTGNLIPTISYSGATISPENGVRQNYSSPVYYTVTAEDGGTETYTVISSVNATVFAGSNDGYLYALYAATGTVKWKIKLGNQVYNPTYNNGVVFCGTFNGPFYAINAETGSIKWKFSKDEGTFSAATVHDGKVYVGYSTILYRTNYLYALGEADGHLIFETKINSSPNFSNLGNPTLANGIIYINDYNFGLNQINAVTGIRLPTRNYGLAILNPAIADNTAYTGIEGVLMFAIDVNTTQAKWSRVTAVPGWNNAATFPPNIYSSATIAGNTLFVGCQGYMCALNRADGAVKWYTPLDGFFSSPVLGNGMVYVGNQDKRIYAFDSATGVLKWTFDRTVSSTENIPNPTFANGFIYTHRADNSVYALDAGTGTMKWKFEAPSGLINSDPCVVDGDGNVFYLGSSGDHN